MEKTCIERGFIQAEAITKEHAKTFYFASRFLEPNKRQAAYSVYSVCRTADDSVDRRSGSPADRITEVEERINAAYFRKDSAGPLIAAFRQTVEQYRIPQVYFKKLTRGMRMDLEKNRYNNFRELYRYCYRVAGVVGLIMLKIFGYSDRHAEKYAVDLGIAMQLTNIMRDIKEDFSMGRIYLPRDEMRRLDLTEDDIGRQHLSGGFIKIMRLYAGRAEKYYRRSKQGIKMISGIRSRFVVCVMRRAYKAIISAIKKNNYDVFNRRAHTSLADKLTIAAKTAIRGEYL